MIVQFCENMVSMVQWCEVSHNMVLVVVVGLFIFLDCISRLLGHLACLFLERVGRVVLTYLPLRSLAGLTPVLLCGDL